MEFLEEAMMATTDPSFLVIDTSNRPLRFESSTSTVFDETATQKGWQLSSYAYDNQGKLWCVGQAGNVAEYDASAGLWNASSTYTTNWTLAAIAFDTNDNAYCVGTAGNSAGWANNQWTGMPFGDQLLMITFDSTGTLWGVKNDNQVYQWVAGTGGAASAWQAQATPGGVLMITLVGTTLWAVTTDNRLVTLQEQDWAIVQGIEGIIWATAIPAATGAYGPTTP